MNGIRHQVSETSAEGRIRDIHKLVSKLTSTKEL